LNINNLENVHNFGSWKYTSTKSSASFKDFATESLFWRKTGIPGGTREVSKWEDVGKGRCVLHHEDKDYASGAKYMNSLGGSLKTPNFTEIGGTAQVSPSFHLLTLPSTLTKPTHIKQEKLERVKEVSLAVTSH